MTTRRGAAALLAAALAPLVAGCAPVAQRTEPDIAGGENVTMVILDGDEFGAVLLDGRHGTYRGVTRDGRLAWEDATTARAAGMVSCLARCPDAAISSSLRSLNSPAVPDPPPQLVVGGQVRELATIAERKRYVLTASAHDDYVLGAGSPATGWWLELHSRGREPLRIPVSGARTSWQESADGRHALAITATDAALREARWFDRTDGRWLPSGSAFPVDGFLGCVSPDGARAVLLAQAPAILDRAGVKRPLSDLVSAGACAFAGQGGIVAEFAQTVTHGEPGRRTRLRGFDSHGGQLWARDLASSAGITADPGAPRVAYVAMGQLHELDLHTGAELRTVRGVLAAQYAGHGEIITVGTDGVVHWLPPV